MRKTSWKAVLWLLVVVAAVSVPFAAGLGPVSVAPGTTAKILLSRLPLFGSLVAPTWGALEENIILGLRLPRVCLGLVVGASLAVCGVTMQALVRNTLADPFILGVSSGASAFATMGMLFGAFSFFGVYALCVSAFLGAAVTIVFVYLISHVGGKIHMTRLLLSGVAVSMIMDGVTTIIKLSAPNALGLHNAEFWMSGSLAGAKWSYLGLPFGVLAVCMVWLLLNYRGLNLLLLGEESAGALGVNVRRLQKMLILAASLMAGVTIAVSGSIGFVGLMVPHFVRLLVGSDHKAPFGTSGGHSGGLGGCGGPPVPCAGGTACGRAHGGSGRPMVYLSADQEYKGETGMRLQIEHLTCSYGKRPAVQDVSLHVAQGEFVGLIGPNGSGKSTVLKSIYRALTPDEGKLRLDGQDMGKLSHRASALKMAVVSQEHDIPFDFTVQEIVAMGRSPHKGLFDVDTPRDRAIVRHALEHMGMEHMAGRSYLQLSGGEKQRVLLARAIAQESDFLILDEPTNHLDVSYQLQIFDFVRRLEVTVLAAIHDLNMAALYCDRLYVLKEGRVILQGTPIEVLTVQNIREVYGVSCTVDIHHRTGRPNITFLPAGGM